MKRVILSARDARELVEFDGKFFDPVQMIYIKRGLKDGVDVSLFANPKFNETKMATIEGALADGYDMSQFDLERLSLGQLDEIIDALQRNVPIDKIKAYAKPGISWKKMRQALYYDEIDN